MNTQSLLAKFALGLSLIAMLAFPMNALAQPTQVGITAPATDGTTVIPGGTVTFSGTATETDTNTLPLTYTWSFPDGTNQTGQNINYQIPSAASAGATITATLAVTNSANEQGDTQPTRSVQVASPADLPTQVSITAPANNAATVIPGGTVTFTGSAVDPNGLALSYTWSFSDGSPDQTGQTVTYSSPANAAVGSTVTATLTVSNANGVSADSTASRLVTVVAAPAPVTGPLVYVTNLASNTVGLIDTTSNDLVATLSVNQFPLGQAVSQNGKYAYILYPNNRTLNGIISVIDPATHTVTAKADVDAGPYGVAVTPDGSLSYATIFDSYGTVTVTNTSTHLVTATIPVGAYPVGIAITPDGKSAYVANFADATVSVIDIASNAVIKTIKLGFNPFRAGDVLSTPTTPFKDFNVQNLLINPALGAFALSTQFTLGDASVGIAPALQQTVLVMDKFYLMIPPGGFVRDGWGNYQFSGIFKGLHVNAVLRPLSGKQYSLDVYAFHSNVVRPKLPLTVKLTIGGEYGSAVWPIPQ
jgi:YVTN family beta-propeller protein